MDGKPKEGERVRCPVCGVFLVDKDTYPVESWDSNVFSVHIAEHHFHDRLMPGCFCGHSCYSWEVRGHIMANGGYEQHYADYLMGACNANQAEDHAH